ncbi:MAG: wax ester/triacylglycerol synthase domain-containing protein [Nocardioides sp.]
MTDVEALMWRAEVDPRLRSDGVVMDLLDSVPDWDRLVAGHEWGTRLAPRLRQRVVEDALHLGPPAWVATDLDLGYHLTRVRLADGAGLPEVLELAAALHMAPFDPARPLWQAVLVEGLPDGKAAYLLKFHHSMADGQGAMQLFDLVHGTRAEPTPGKEAPEARPHDPTGPAALAAKRVAALPGSLGTAARLVKGLGAGAVRTVAHPQAAVTYVQSLGRVTQAQGEPSPLLSERGLSRRVRTVEVPFHALRAAGRAAGGTLNDAYLAGLLGGLRHYHAEHGVEVREVPMALPVSLRQVDHALGGNRFAAAYIAGPATEADPAERVRLVRRRVLSARAEPALDFLGVTAPVTSRLPSPLLAALSVRFAGAIDLQASNIPGINRSAYLAGARIERMFVFGPVPGSAIMATLLSHEDTCCIGVVTDQQAVPDPDVLLACVERGLAEVLALGRPA